MTKRELRMLAGGFLAGLAIVVVLSPVLFLHHHDLPLERQLGDLAVSTVSRVLGGDAQDPLGPGPRVTEAGQSAYAGSCSTCHGSKGDGRGVFGLDIYPNATDLTAANTASKTDAQIFWIVKNGLSFTAMPGFARQYSDSDIWEVVAYVRALQQAAGRPVSVPSPTRKQLSFADPYGTQLQRGAATYFAQGCAGCHGPIGNAPGPFSLTGPTTSEAIRTGGAGMPRYAPDRISDAELADLLAYVATLRGR